MSAEKSGFNIKVTCTQDQEINFSCRSKKRPGIRIGDKIDMTTDSTIGSRTYEPGALFEVTDGELTVLDDPVNADRIISVLGKKGTISFTGKVSGTTISYPNAWFASYTPNEMKNDSVPPTATIMIQSDGTLPQGNAAGIFLNSMPDHPLKTDLSISGQELVNAFLPDTETME